MTEEIVIAKIPSILTLSTRIIVKHFGKSIFKLKARGGLSPQGKVWLNENLGISQHLGDSNRIEINYERETDIAGKILNPLNNVKINSILKYLDTNLGKVKDGKYKSDIPVSLLMIEIEDDVIAEIMGTETNIFHLTFKSDIADSEKFKEKIYESNKDLGVYFQGFEKRNLNLFRCIEKIKLEESKSDINRLSIIYWRGFSKQHLAPRSSQEVAMHIFENYLPINYKSLKNYIITQENRIELDGYKVG